MINNEWNTQREIEHFDHLWQAKRHGSHTVNYWNKRADNWSDSLKTDSDHRKRNEHRVQLMVDYLKGNGLLRPEDTVIDIGCGTGRFAAAFAQHVAHVTAVDVSERMILHSAEYAQSQGLHNMEFLSCDFKDADLRQLGWEKKFHLVFASLTPAVSSAADIARIESICKGWCLFSTFAYRKDPLARAALQEIMPSAASSSWKDGRAFYAAMNLLWLMGRYPAVSYHTESSTEFLPADENLVQRISSVFPGDSLTGDIPEKIHRFVMERADQDGLVTYETEYRYGHLLWNVNEQDKRDYSYGF